MPGPSAYQSPCLRAKPTIGCRQLDWRSQLDPKRKLRPSPFSHRRPSYSRNQTSRPKLSRNPRCHSPIRRSHRLFASCASCSNATRLSGLGAVSFAACLASSCDFAGRRRAFERPKNSFLKIGIRCPRFRRGWS